MPIPRIYTVFEFKPEQFAGVVPYARHLVAGNSFEQAKEAILARAILTTGGAAYMNTDESAEACRYECMVNVNRDNPEGLSVTFEEARRWIKMNTSPHIESGVTHEPTHARIW